MSVKGRLEYNRDKARRRTEVCIRVKVIVCRCVIVLRHVSLLCKVSAVRPPRTRHAGRDLLNQDT